MSLKTKGGTRTLCTLGGEQELTVINKNVLRDIREEIDKLNELYDSKLGSEYDYDSSNLRNDGSSLSGDSPKLGNESLNLIINDFKNNV